MPLTQKIAIAAGALTLAAGGVAAAAGSPSGEADKGLTTAEEQVGVELPATQDVHPEDVTDTDAEDEAPEPEATEVESEQDDEGTGPVDNHGAEVSAVATSDDTTGREHGEAVSAVARDNAGAAHVADEDSDDQEVDADEAASSHGRP